MIDVGRTRNSRAAPLFTPSMKRASVSFPAPAVSAIACGCLAVALTIGATSADTRVYRCEVGSAVTYTDVPCPNARELTVEGGKAAPDARERLARNQQALDVRAAQRRDALAREAELERMEALRVREAAATNVPDAGYGAPGDYAYPAYAPLPLDRARARPRNGQHRRGQRNDKPSFIPAPQPHHA